MNDKKLRKSSVDCKLSGVCGGIAEYFDMDSTIVRLLWCLFTLAGGSGIIAYIVAAIIMPDAYEG
ncbi:phage shock protein C (PspC) family protein [Lachnospiraceae bacterium XBB1006]|nr:phage shock protein C (PspC) family protein [Lachnospiraceae bacterium XBB1006]